MKKISDLTNMDVIHCPTEKEANAILKLAHKAGYPWGIKSNCWNYHKENSCYCIIKGNYSEIDWYTTEGYTIHKASEFLEPIKYTIEYCKNNKVAIEIKSEEDLQLFKKMTGTNPRSCYVPNISVTLNHSWCDTSWYIKKGYELISFQQFVKDNTEQDLIPYEEFVLPEKWCVKVTPESKQTLGEWRDAGDLITSGGYCHSYHRNNKGWHDDEIIKGYAEISFEQFKKYVLKQDDMQEIIGYKLKDEFMHLKEAVVNISNALVYPSTGHYTSTGNYKSIDNFTKAGVLDLWFEPVYKQDEYKIGDWVYWSGNNPTFAKINSEIGTDNCYKLDVDGNISSHNSCHKSNLRKATQEEIKNHLVSLAKEKGFVEKVEFTGVRDTTMDDWGSAIGKPNNCTYFASKAKLSECFTYNPNTDTLTTYGYGVFVVYEKGKWATITPKEKVVSVGGKFSVTIKDGKIWHSSSNITDFVKGLVTAFNFEDEFGGYKANIKNVTFSKTGCQHVETTLEDWKKVLHEYNKLNS